MTKPKEESWQYLIREMTYNLKPVQHLSRYLKHNNVKFFLKDAYRIANRARNGPRFTTKDLPNTVGQEHQETVTELLNNVFEHYEKQRATRTNYKASIEKMKRKIPETERKNLQTANDYNFYLDDPHDKWLAKMNTKAAVKEWLNTDPLFRKAWFKRIQDHINKRRNDNEKQAEHFEQLHQIRNKLWAYEVLGISHLAERNKIRNAWKELIRQHHPDHGGDPKKYDEIQRAYQAIIFTA